MKNMSSDPASDDSSSPHNATLDLVIQILMEHEQEMAKLVGRLDELKPKLDNTKTLSRRLDEIEISLGKLESEIRRLINYLSVSKLDS
ncbi:MAG: hypothetical protein ACQCN4_09620 [Candidatus Bathyarchaeia archaeon]|jgi:tetrahydromethanopterin S-methyltransferase subunit G